MTRFARWRKTYNTSTIQDDSKGTGRFEPYEAGAHGNFSKKKVCLKCRQPGHSIKDCPSGNELTSICYNCGSAEHTLKACPEPRKATLEFAKCYVCTETGHLASQCPKNDKGIYPDGGCCRFCGSTRHLARECNPTAKDANAVMVSAVEEGADLKKLNPEDDYVFETLQKMQEAKRTARKEKAAAKEKKKSSAKVVKF